MGVDLGRGPIQGRLHGSELLGQAVIDEIRTVAEGFIHRVDAIRQCIVDQDAQIIEPRIESADMAHEIRVDVGGALAHRRLNGREAGCQLHFDILNAAIHRFDERASAVIHQSVQALGLGIEQFLCFARQIRLPILSFRLHLIAHPVDIVGEDGDHTVG